MYIYILNICLILIESFIILKNKLGNSYKKLFIWIVSIQFVLISGLRDINIGADTIVYEQLFNYYATISWKVMLDNFIGMFTNRGTYENRDMGYYAFSKLFTSVCPSYRVYLFFIIILFMIGFSFFIYKYSNDYCMSYVIFASFLFAFFGLTGIRQTLATILCVFIGFEFIRKRKLLKFLLIIFIASFFHQTSLIFLPFYFLYNIKIDMTYEISVPILFGIIFILKSKIASIFLMGTYAKYGASTDLPPYNLFLLITLIVFFSLFFYDRLKKINSNINIYINAVVIGMFLLELSLVIPIFVRLSYYYIIFIVLLIPEFFNLIIKKERSILKGIFYLILIGLLLKTGITYQFMWQ